MTIRRAEVADARGIAEVHVSAWKSAYRGLLPDSLLDNLSVDESEKRWEERLAKLWGKFLVSVQNGSIVGFAASGASRDEDVDEEKVGEVYAIYVDPKEWRQGYGRELIEETIGLLREEDFQEAILWVLEGNEHAVGFYEAAGFEADGTRKVKVRSDGVEMKVARYRRSI